MVSDVDRLDMLDTGQRMLQRLRAATQSDMNGMIESMNSMIEQDSMWVDPVMIRLQEEQTDRMIGRRQGQP